MQRRAITTDTESESDGGKSKPKGTSVTTKRLRRPSTTATTTQTRAISTSTSPEPRIRRRKSSAAVPNEAAQPKRKRADTQSSQRQSSGVGGEDAARKYCLTKLQEIFCKIFLRYPILPGATSEPAAEGDEGEGEAVVDKKPQDLTEEERELLESRAKKFAAELEGCMFEIYAEPDKTGKHGVAAKYK